MLSLHDEKLFATVDHFLKCARLHDITILVENWVILSLATRLLPW